MQRQSNIKYLQDYNSVMANYNGAVDQTVIRDIMNKKSILENMSASLPHFMGKSASQFSFEDLKNSKKPD